MKALYVASAIRKPFGFLDVQIQKALEQCGVRTRSILPGPRLDAELRKVCETFAPDVLIAMLGCRLSPGNLRRIASLSIPKAIWCTDDPYAIDQSVRSCRYFDAVFTNDSRCIPVYRSAGCNRVYHLPLAAPYPVYAPRRVSGKYRSRICILGSAFENRLKEVDRIAPLLSAHPTRIIGPGWHRLTHYGQLRRNIRGGWVSPKEAAAYYNGADIVLNIHRAPDDPYLGQNRRNIPARTPNNRLFEIAACSAFQLISYREDLNRLYTPDREIVSYRCTKELEQLIRHYLRHPEERKEIARRAFDRTLREHLYTHRMQEMLRRLGFSPGQVPNPRLDGR